MRMRPLAKRERTQTECEHGILDSVVGAETDPLRNRAVLLLLLAELSLDTEGLVSTLQNRTYDTAVLAEHSRKRA